MGIGPPNSPQNPWPRSSGPSASVLVRRRPQRTQPRNPPPSRRRIVGVAKKKNETSYTPGSVVPTARMAIHLDLALPSGSSSLPEGFGRAVLERLLLGLAPDEACHAANCHQRPGGLLHRRFTLTHRPKPVRRSILCCAISQVALGGRYPPSCSMEPGSSSTDKIGRGHQEVSNAQL